MRDYAVSLDRRPRPVDLRRHLEIMKTITARDLTGLRA